MKSPQDSEAHQLLEAFVASNRSERAFRALVENLSSLAYAGALRRTRDPQLAEEISQNVFALLAQRAKSLRKHPSLLAWIHETTRLQCATAMRAERRRQRKAAALANEINTRDAMSMHPSDQTSE